MRLRLMLLFFCAALSACGHRPKPMGVRLLPRGLGRLTDAGVSPTRPMACAPLVWTASQWQTAFVGTGLSIWARCLSEPRGPERCGGALDVQVDNAPFAPLAPVTRQGGYIDVAQELPPGRHTVVVRRNQEAQLGAVCLCDARVTQGAFARLPKAPKRNLLVIGDSISAGYGNLCPGVSAGDPLRLQDGSKSYGSIAARALGAQVRILAWSGRGLWRNGDGTFAGTLPKLWQEARRDVVGPQALDAVVVNLGTNDLRRPGVDEEAFVSRYVDFVEQLERAYPGAHLFLAVGPMLLGPPEKKGAQEPINGEACGLQLIGETLRRLRRNACQQARPQPRAHLLRFAPQDGAAGYGCDYHPNAATHAQMAEVLQQALASTLGW